MSSSSLDSLALRISLIKRFSVAILLVLLTIILSFFAVHWQLRRNQRDGYLINISGRQRMLSQRIGLLATGIRQGDQQSWQRESRIELLELTGEMRTVHQQLFEYAQRSQGLAPTMAGLDQQVRRFLKLAEQVGSENKSDYKQERKLIDMSSSQELLRSLDRFVLALENDYESKLASFRAALLFLAVIAALILAVISFSIFRPTVRLVSDSLLHLEDANSELQEFAYRISHDLRSPVVTAKGIAEVARDSLRSGDIAMAEESLERVLKSLDRANTTSKDMVGLIKQKMADVESESFDVSEVIDESIEAVRDMPDFDRISLIVDCPDRSGVTTKRLLVKQTVVNLLSNAIKYRDTSVEQSRIELVVRFDDGNCMVSVRDNGLGISKDCRSRMFGMFQRFHPKVAYGTGLGLYLVSQNVASLSGSVAYHPLQKGSQFDVRFPVTGA